MTDRHPHLALVASLFTEQMPYSGVLDLRILDMTAEQIAIEVPFQPHLVGNMFHQILHGGVTAAILDCAGGIMIATDIALRHPDWSQEQLLQRFARLSTIDLRTDYIRPGRGKCFRATARLLRHGNKVAVARMEMHNEAQQLIALGTATYMVG